jgi:hypothetical protein
MCRCVLLAFVALLAIGCKTGEVKNTNDVGLAAGVPTGSLQSNYGDGKGDSVGGGGAAAPINADSGAQVEEKH